MTDIEIGARTGPPTLPQPGARSGGRHRRTRSTPYPALGASQSGRRPAMTIAALLVLALIVLVVAVAALGVVT